MDVKNVYTWGVFDMLHVGHLESLRKAARLGDRLTVGVYTDEVAESLKRKPIIPLEERVTMLEALDIVDDVKILKTRMPEFMRMNNWTFAKGPGASWESYYDKTAGGALLPYHPDQSTSKIIERCRLLQQ